MQSLNIRIDINILLSLLIYYNNINRDILRCTIHTLHIYYRIYHFL